jgi:hypothetical protein
MARDAIRDSTTKRFESRKKRLAPPPRNVFGAAILTLWLYG